MAGPARTVLGMWMLLAIGGCSSPPVASTREETDMQLTSSAFHDGGRIPTEHSCDGEDVSPPLAWSGAPEGTEAFVLVVEDPDAGNFVHWLLTDIPGDTDDMPAGQGDRIGRPGRSSFGAAGWGGPCPPSGEHRYVFTLYAVSQPVAVGDGASASDARQAMTGHILAEAQLSGRYAREG
ncbi:MAG TPA: YbhB/YbcL family Raf kinase inhibitor-like protein [Candidatus Limnocylindria bacterium]